MATTDSAAPADAASLTLPLVVVADPVSEEGLVLIRPHARVEIVHGKPEALEAALPHADALLVRSETRVTRELLARAPKLKVIGRAGAGVDTIDVEAATERGIVVVNAPGGNAVAAAEHAVALMFALARRVAIADASMKRGEWNRSKYVGLELAGKTLGLVGLGRVGSEVLKRAIGLGMRVLVFDPYVADDQVRRLGGEPMELDALLGESLFISVHTPLTDTTHGLIDARRLALMPKGSYVINCARGQLIDTDALMAALDSGHLAGAGIDVYEKEPVSPDDPLPKHAKIVATPHLGASTVEAQTNVAVQVAYEVLSVLDGLPAQYAVNAPNVRAEEAQALRPYMDLATILGKIAMQLADGRVQSAEITYRGDIATGNVNAVTAAALQGMLQSVSADHVTLVNARIIAQNRGLTVSETKNGTTDQYTSLVRLSVITDRGTTVVAGTVSEGRAIVTRIDDYALHLSPPNAGYLLLAQHTDKPGTIGAVGTLFGQADVNISSMQVGREAPRGQALMILSLDDLVTPDVVERLKAVANVEYIKVIKL